MLDLRGHREPRPLDKVAFRQQLGIEYRVDPVAAGTLGHETLERNGAVLRMANAEAS